MKSGTIHRLLTVLTGLSLIMGSTASFATHAGWPNMVKPHYYAGVPAPSRYIVHRHSYHHSPQYHRNVVPGFGLNYQHYGGHDQFPNHYEQPSYQREHSPYYRNHFYVNPYSYRRPPVVFFHHRN